MSDITKEHLHWVADDAYNDRVIVSAANRYPMPSGEMLVVPCVRHYSKEHHAILDGLLLSGTITSTRACGENQGFVDQYSNYWTREEALVIATAADQINVRRPKGWPEYELFSEDLY